MPELMSCMKLDLYKLFIEDIDIVHPDEVSEITRDLPAKQYKGEGKIRYFDCERKLSAGIIKFLNFDQAGVLIK